MNKFFFGILSLALFSCGNIKSIHYGHETGSLCYNVFYNKNLNIKSFDGVEYHVYMFYNNNDFLYLTSDNGIPGENYDNMMKIINNDSVAFYEFMYNNKLPRSIKGKDENGYYYNYTDTIINIGYSNVKSRKSKRHFDYIIKHLQKCNNKSND
ncbi:hypothetical protein H1R17_00680 [Flavobacterium sp. xlx-214]|uniref:hypothetical protein n=1 Tax=unclassified Flavobacterium TaxID=196869 RepID=UPI0013D7586E|nr:MULTISPECIES: hypothetical protein [unclassified Flavobacterium]MBA5794066.1 hypothetical protein [Flavobacterium sp. xlx-221]QMI83691.1 hypothetical protein H1R17_00680 [Flavobacterium sp. xlx-214]